MRSAYVDHSVVLFQRLSSESELLNDTHLIDSRAAGNIWVFLKITAGENKGKYLCLGRFRALDFDGETIGLQAVGNVSNLQSYRLRTLNDSIPQVQTDDGQVRQVLELLRKRDRKIAEKAEEEDRKRRREEEENRDAFLEEEED